MLQNENLKLVNKLRINENGLITTHDGQRLYLPSPNRKAMLNMLYNDLMMGHLGINKTLPRIVERFIWMRLRKDVQSWVKACTRCQRKKFPARWKRQSNLEQIIVYQPWKLVAFNIMPLPVIKSGNKYVVVFTDYLTRWVKAFAIRHADATTIANLFV